MTRAGGLFRRPDRRLVLPLACLAAASLAGCAERSCDNPYVLDFLTSEDARSNLAHRGLVRNAVRSDPGPTPDTARCAIWEQVSNPAYGSTAQQPATVLQPQYYSVTRITDGWRLTP